MSTSRKRWALAAAALVVSPLLPFVRAAVPVHAAPGDADEIVALVVDGVGFGHGRGLSQWGSFGWAVNYGWGWQQILDHYYGGTVTSDVGPGDFWGVPPDRMTVRLVGVDGLPTAVVSSVQQASLAGVGGSYGTIVAREETEGQYRVRGTSAVVCPSISDPLEGWVDLGLHAAPTITTPGGENTATPSGQLLGVCQGDGSVIHYRGVIRAVNGSAGENRTVNDVSLEAYLRGVVPRESPASWGDSGGGAGMNALRAQAVAARSYALSEGATTGGTRYSYAKTCDTTSCQVYGGAAFRANAGPSTGYLPREHENSDAAVAQTAGKIRRWTDGRPFSVVSTEFSSSNGPRTAGGSFPAVDDPADDVPGNKLHRWTRVIGASELESKYGLGDLVSGTSQHDAATTFDGIWGNQVVLQGTATSKTIVNWDFRNAFGLPSPGFTVRAVTRGVISLQDFAFIGDSVGAGVSQNGNNELPALLDGVFATARYDAVSSRCTVGCAVSPDGVGVAESLETGTELVVVELGYNDPSNYTAKIDEMMAALRAKGVERVAWVNLSTRSGKAAYSSADAALALAQSRWPELTVLDWNAASSGPAKDRWFASDGVHLTSTGDAEFSLWLRNHVLALATAGPGKLGKGRYLRIPVSGVAGVPPSGVSAVALNVTAVDPAAWGYFTLWPCGSEMPLDASHVNFIEAGAVEPNSVLAPLDETGEVCLWTFESSHVLVDVNGWFTEGFEGSAPTRIVDTRSGQGAPQGKLPAGQMLRVPVSGVGGVPESGVSAVALNVTGVEAAGWGFFTVWPCASEMPLDASHVNFIEEGAIEPNSVLVPVDETGEICIWTYTDAHVLVDVNGWFTSGFEGRAPDRIVDTREGRGAPKGKLGAGQVLRVPVVGVGDVPSSDVTAVALNVTAAEAAGWGFFTVWPCGSAMPPDASHVNFVEEGAVEPNSVLALVDHTGEICIWTYEAAHVLVDVNGWFTSGFHGTNPTRIVDTRSGQFGPL